MLKIILIIFTVLGILFWAFVGYGIYLNLQWEQEVKERFEHNEQIMQQVLLKPDYTLCENHSYEYGCIVVAALTADNISVCESAHSNNMSIFGCKAAFLSDSSICDSLSLSGAMSGCRFSSLKAREFASEYLE